MNTCTSLRSYPSEWLKSFILGVHSLYMISMFTNCEIQLDGKNPHLTKLRISEWSTFDRRVKRSSIEPKEILCTGLKSHFVTKYLVDGLVLVHGLSLMECRIPNTNIPRESDHSLNVMTGLYCVLNKILAIYVARQMIQNVLWAEVYYSSPKTQKFHMISRSNLQTQLVKLKLM